MEEDTGTISVNEDVSGTFSVPVGGTGSKPLIFIVLG